MPRPWTGKAPLKKSKKNIPLFDSFNPPPPGMKGVKHVEMPGPFPLGKFPQEGKTREEILGEPLKRDEIRMLVKPYLSDNRQVNIGELASLLYFLHFYQVKNQLFCVDHIPTCFVLFSAGFEIFSLFELSNLCWLSLNFLHGIMLCTLMLLFVK